MSTTAILERAEITDPMLPHTATVQAIRSEAYGISTFYLEYNDPSAPVGFIPGQFNMIYLPGFGEVAISICSDPTTPKIMEHTVRYAAALRAPLGASGLVTLSACADRTATPGPCNLLRARI